MFLYLAFRQVGEKKLW